MIGLYEFIGAVGLVLIILGMLTNTKKHELIYYIFGGSALAVYSVYVGNLIFIILQFAFILAAIYDLIKISNK